MVFLISGQGYFIFLYQFTTERVEEKKNNYGLGLDPSARREKSVTLLWILCFCGLTEAWTQAKHPQATSNADLSSRAGQPSIWISIALSVTFLNSVDWSCLCPALISWQIFTWLPTPADWPKDFPSLVLFWSRGRYYVLDLCVGFAPKQTKESSDRHLPTLTEMNATHRVTSCHALLLSSITSSSSSTQHPVSAQSCCM